jgi:hypothetical protein
MEGEREIFHLLPGEECLTASDREFALGNSFCGIQKMPYK